jgi:hypothetical protein
MSPGKLRALRQAKARKVREATKAARKREKQRRANAKKAAAAERTRRKEEAVARKWIDLRSVGPIKAIRTEIKPNGKTRTVKSHVYEDHPLCVNVRCKFISLTLRLIEKAAFNAFETDDAALFRKVPWTSVF